MSDVKLNQIIAVVNGKKTRNLAALTGIYQKLEKKELFDGFNRKYLPSDETGEVFPTENKVVQMSTSEVIADVRKILTDSFDCVLTQECGNTVAKANIVVNGNVIASDVPVTYLLYLEKQLIDVKNVVNKIPVLSNSETWSYDSNKNLYVTNEVKTNKTKKVKKVLIKYAATVEHPAQTETYDDDTKIGEWVTVQFSGAMPAKEKGQTLERIEALIEGVKQAREEANNIKIVSQKIADELFNFVFTKQGM